MISTVIIFFLFVGANALPRTRRLDSSHVLIVGGRPAEQGEAPYQLSLRYGGNHRCGASLIEVQGVILGITAAHCILPGMEIDLFTLVAGDLNLSDETGIEQTRNVVKIVLHEGFYEYTYENDIALIFTDEPFELNENVMTIPLPEAGTVTSGELVVSGWGKLSYNGPDPDRLQIVKLPVVSHAECQAAYSELGDTIYEHFLCAGLLHVGGKDACQGDSGGPAKSADLNYLAGIVSWGEECANPKYPGIYTDVTYFIDWIETNVAEHSKKIVR